MTTILNPIIAAAVAISPFAVRLMLAARLSRRLKSVDREPLAGEWVRVECQVPPDGAGSLALLLVSLRGKPRLATCDTALPAGAPARVVAPGSPLSIEPWPSS